MGAHSIRNSEGFWVPELWKQIQHFESKKWKKKEKGFDNSSQHLKTMLRGVYIQNILLTNAVWQQETVSPLEDEVELLFFLGLGT